MKESYLLVEEYITVEELKEYLSGELIIKQTNFLYQGITPTIYILKDMGDIRMMGCFYVPVQELCYGPVSPTITKLFHSNNKFQQILAKKKIIKILIERMEKRIKNKHTLIN